MNKKNYWAYRIDTAYPKFFFEEIKNGRLRQGWGYDQGQNLKNFTVNNGAGGNYPIFNKVKKGDILLVPRLPKWNDVSILIATEDFDKEYKFEIDSKLGDYGHIFPVDYLFSFERDIELNVPRRFWNINHLSTTINEKLNESKNQIEKTKVEIQNVIATKKIAIELLSENLSIPNYQRAYCWKKENILKFLEGAKNFLQKHDEFKEISFHCGTIITKKNHAFLDIIDGQQRLLTLAILLHCLGENIPLLKQSLLGNENLSEKGRGFLIRAKKTINTWIETNEDIAEKLPYKLDFCLIQIPEIENDDLAYFFFNTTNSTGKRLSNYDLLKNHHLRFVNNNSAEFVATRWNYYEETEKSDLLHKNLYRLRQWNRKKDLDVNADKTKNHLLFKHFAVKEDPIPNIYENLVSPNFDSKITGGMEFFSYVNNYHTKLIQYNKHDPIIALRKHLSWHSYGVLHDAIKAISFLFYCKFGEQYLKEALYCIAYRVSIIRNEKKQVRRTCLHTEPVFKDIVEETDRATSIASFFSWALEVDFRYTIDRSTLVKEKYWNSLLAFFEELSKGADFVIKSQIKNINIALGEINDQR